MKSHKGYVSTQIFGDTAAPEDESAEQDLISAVSFDHSGDYLATGDRGGRVVLFERNRSGTRVRGSARPFPEYTFFSEFQSHESEFDYLKSLDIEEAIRAIKWVRRSTNSLFLLTTNDKTVKLWKVFGRELKTVSSLSAAPNTPQRAPASMAGIGSSGIVFPEIVDRERIIATTARRVYSNAHAFHINAVSLSSDDETFISSDDLRINLWNLAEPDRAFNIVDLKPDDMEKLSEVITCSSFHPHHNSLFLYATSKGTVRLADMRGAALCDNHAKVLQPQAEQLPSSCAFYAELLASISDARFSADGRQIVTRDYLHTRIWDTRNLTTPVHTIAVHNFVIPELAQLYEHDLIFDRFSVLQNSRGELITGSYNHHVHVYNGTTGRLSYFLDVTAKPEKKKSTSKKMKLRGKKAIGPDAVDPATINFSKRVLHLDCHPSESTLAIAAGNNLYMYHKSA